MSANKSLHEQADQLFKLVEKLFNETSGLRRDVERLAGRIEPFSGEQFRPPDQFTGELKSFKAAFDVIEGSRISIRKAEYDLNAIRGHIDNIASDGISREEMKPWLK